ncbi:hypothetical protein [Flavobacterium davisii]|uniref:Uncharacterized protein n=1 Tax=Flavobacterium davisii TaxID=2906077 RepID=A0A246GFC7_9FLAO|nr:hypothetical protein [Flavobacterium davisii]OWP82839.1 hypothetical protein BWK59_13745 [Flavobacterium davisii]
MNKIIIIPLAITILQFLGSIHLLYTHKYGDAQIPKSFIELHIWAIISIFVLILSYFLYFNAKERINLWLIPIGFSTLTILLLIVCYIIMAIYKYK